MGANGERHQLRISQAPRRDAASPADLGLLLQAAAAHMQLAEKAVAVFVYTRLISRLRGEEQGAPARGKPAVGAVPQEQQAASQPGAAVARWGCAVERGRHLLV